MIRRIMSLLLACSCALAQTTPPADAVKTSSKLRPMVLEDLYSERNVVNAAISPSGRHLAVIVRRELNDMLMVMDLTTREHKVIRSTSENSFGKLLSVRMAAAYWKSDDRLIFRMRVKGGDGVRTLNPGDYAKLGDRLVAIDRDGGNVTPLLADNRNAALNGALDLGDIASLLPNDPKHILLEIGGFNGRSLYKVNLENGRGEQLERSGENVIGWYLDVAGNPVVRMTMSMGTIVFSRREGSNWVKFLKMPVRETMERWDYDFVGASDQPGKYYVIARSTHDRAGLYLYDLEKESFGEPLIEHPEFDLASARISRDGKRVISYCYVAHVEVCEFTDPKLNAHMKGLRKMFEDSANVGLHDTSEDGKSLVLFVESPRDPPAYYYYLTESRRIETVGAVQQVMTQVELPRASLVRYDARDGKPLTGYLTLPAKAPKDVRLPLVIYPHGGPEVRDSLSFDRWAQYFAALGYAVFQPNYRGSDGFGKAFAESGYGEWGRKMQDDISDSVKLLIDQGVADPQRVCIVGASYGGYAALAGATLTPDLYKCAVSIAGLADLDEFINWRKTNWGSDSMGYLYWLKAIGNPETDAQRLREISPRDQIGRIKAPLLLVHGTDDLIVPISQSRMMKRLLDQSGRKTPIIELEHEGHGGWTKENEMYALSNIAAFLWTHLGPGYGMTTPPVALNKPR